MHKRLTVYIKVFVVDAVLIGKSTVVHQGNKLLSEWVSIFCVLDTTGSMTSMHCHRTNGFVIEDVVEVITQHLFMWSLKLTQRQFTLSIFIPALLT